MPIHGQLNVRALNDGFRALNSVAAMSQSGRLPPDADATVVHWLVADPNLPVASGCFFAKKWRRLANLPSTPSIRQQQDTKPHHPIE
jgi:hypothetical protein